MTLSGTSKKKNPNGIHYISKLQFCPCLCKQEGSPALGITYVSQKGGGLTPRGPMQLWSMSSLGVSYSAALEGIFLDAFWLSTDGI
jgi:hypothetical protein